MQIVYVLTNKEGKLYKGITSDLNKRLWYHNNNLSGYTKNKGPWKLVYKEEYSSKKTALIREKFLKSGKGRELLKNIIHLYGT